MTVANQFPLQLAVRPCPWPINATANPRLAPCELRACTLRSLFTTAVTKIEESASHAFSGEWLNKYFNAYQQKTMRLLERLCNHIALGTEDRLSYFTVLKITALTHLHMLPQTKRPSEDLVYACIEAIALMEIFFATGDQKFLDRAKNRLEAMDLASLASVESLLACFEQPDPLALHAARADASPEKVKTLSLALVPQLLQMMLFLKDPDPVLPLLVQPLSFQLKGLRSTNPHDFALLNGSISAMHIVINYVRHQCNSTSLLPRDESHLILEGLICVRANLCTFQQIMREYTDRLKDLTPQQLSSEAQRHKALLQKAKDAFYILYDSIRSVMGQQKQDPLEVPLLQPLLSLARDLEVIVLSQCVAPIQYNQDYLDNLKQFKTLIPTSYSHVRITRLALLMNEIVQCLSHITPSKYPNLEGSFAWLFHCMVHQNKEFPDAIQAIIKQLQDSPEIEAKRLFDLMQLLSGFASCNQYEMLCAPVGDSREIKAEEVQFLRDLLKQIHWISNLFEVLSSQVPIRGKADHCEVIKKFISLGRNLHQFYCTMRDALESGQDFKKIILEHREKIEQFEKEKDELKLQIATFLHKLPPRLNHLLTIMKDCLSIIFYITLAHRSYAQELLVEIDTASKQKARKVVFGFIPLQEDAPLSLPAVEEKSILQQVQEVMQHVGTLEAAAFAAPIIQRHYLPILHEILEGKIIQWQPSLVAQEALSKCALLVEQTLKIRLNVLGLFHEKLRSEHNFLTLLASLSSISLTAEERALLQQLNGMNVNLTEGQQAPVIIQELSQYMHLYQCLYDNQLTSDEEGLLIAKFGKKSNGEWIACLEQAISGQIVAVKKIVKETLQLVHQWLSPLGKAEARPVDITEAQSENPDRDLLAIFQVKVDALEQKTASLLEHSKGELPLQRKQYLLCLKEQLEHLRRALEYPFTNCDHTYKTILATTIAKTMESAELAALMTHPIHDTGGEHIFDAHTVTKEGREKKLIHTHRLSYFYGILASHLGLEQRGPIGGFQYHLKTGARYPTFEDELFQRPISTLLAEGLKIIDMIQTILAFC